MQNNATALAQHYLEKHAVPAEKFGLGPYLETWPFSLLAADPTFHGSFNLSLSPALYSDCGTIAQRMRSDIALNHPELNPIIAGFTTNGYHFWVEITDPANGRPIQIDGTPWYNKLNPGHTGKPIAVKTRQLLHINSTYGPPLSLRILGEEQLTTYLFGVLPNCSTEERMADIEKGLSKTLVAEKPDYRFVVQSVREAGFGNPKDVFTVYFEIPDSEKLHKFLQITKDMEDLAALGVIRTGVIINGRAIEHNFEWIKRIADANGQGQLFAEIEANFRRLVRLFECARPVLRTTGGNMLVVKTGYEIPKRYELEPRQSDKIELTREYMLRLAAMFKDATIRKENRVRLARC